MDKLIRITIQGGNRILAHLEAMNKRIGPRTIQQVRETTRVMARNIRQEISKRKKWERFGGSELRPGIRAVTKQKAKKESVGWVISRHPRMGGIPADRGARPHYETNPWGPTWTPRKKKGNQWLHATSRPLNYLEPALRKTISEMRKRIRHRFRVESLVR